MTERPLVWVEPWSLWWTGPGARCRLQIAIRNALTIDWERVWSPIDQPTTRARSSRSPSRSRASRRWCGAVDVGEIGPVRCLGPEGPLDQVIGGCAGPLAEQGQCTPCSQLCRDRLDGAAGDSKPLHRTSFAWTRRLPCCRRNWRAPGRSPPSGEPAPTPRSSPVPSATGSSRSQHVEDRARSPRRGHGPRQVRGPPGTSLCEDVLRAK